MAKVIMLTQENCPNCSSLKMFLEFGMKNKYKDDIEVVHRQSDESRFMELVQTYDVASTPVLIADDEVLRDCSPTKTIEFLNKAVQ